MLLCILCAVLPSQQNLSQCRFQHHTYEKISRRPIFSLVLILKVTLITIPVLNPGNFPLFETMCYTTSYRELWSSAWHERARVNSALITQHGLSNQVYKRFDFRRLEVLTISICIYS